VNPIGHARPADVVAACTDIADEAVKGFLYLAVVVEYD
jgi:hypothetical protein